MQQVAEDRSIHSMDQQLVETTMSSSAQAQLPPGFRFHPTDEELIVHYLRNRAASAACPVPIIADVDIYKFDPWELPAKALYGDSEYYFFSPRDRKYPNGIRPNRAAGSGYWKATGTDKPIHHTAAADTVVVGVKKALVFYKGRPPRGTKTNWIMHEYRLAAPAAATPLAAAAYRPPSKFRNVSMRLDDWVLCRIYKKSGQASPMVPPLADYDHLDHDEPSSGGGFDDMCSGSSFLYAPTTSAGSSSTTATSTAAIIMHQPAPALLPKIPSISDLLIFDEYALAQIFDAPVPADQLAVHPSLNQLLSVGEHSDLTTTIYDSPAAACGKRKATDVCVAGTVAPAAGHHHPPAKRLIINGGSCFDAPQPATGLLPAAPSSVLGGINHHMLPQF